MLNRLSFLLLDFDFVSHATAAVLALALAWLASNFWTTDTSTIGAGFQLFMAGQADGKTYVFNFHVTGN